tara:strand:- start:1029 stop:1415 length:387 start_codon:yes stop_codon:yes gene_type:complete
MESPTMIKPTVKKKTKDESKEKELPSSQQILNAIYEHYGKPMNIVKEVVKLYMGYTSPAGASQGNWIKDGFQLGRVNVYTSEKSKKDCIFQRTTIKDEGEGTWFIGVKHNELRIWISGKIDTTLTIKD